MKGKSLVRGVHAEVSLIKADGTTNAFVVDRGKVTAESASSVTLLRKDGVSVTLGLNADTKVRGDIQVDKGAIVFSRGGTAFAVLAPRSAEAAPLTLRERIAGPPWSAWPAQGQEGPDGRRPRGREVHQG